jgi:hypothetical protein
MCLGAPFFGALLDHVEVEHQVQRGDHDDTMLMPMPSGPVECMNDTGMPNARSAIVTSRPSAIAPVAAMTPRLKRSSP